MDTVLDLDAAIAQIPSALEDAEKVLTSSIPRVIEEVEAIVKKVNAPTLTKQAEVFINALNTLKDGPMRQMVGREDDSASTGSSWGLLHAAKQMHVAMYGE